MATDYAFDTHVTGDVMIDGALWNMQSAGDVGVGQSVRLEVAVRVGGRHVGYGPSKSVYKKTGLNKHSDGWLFPHMTVWTPSAA